MKVKFLSREIRSNTQGSIKATVVAEVTFEDTNETIVHKRSVAFNVAASAPVKRIYRKMITRAEADILAEFNCDDAESSNIFADLDEESEHKGLSFANALDLHRKLRSIEKECVVAA